jgi:hypothetical protein
MSLSITKKYLINGPNNVIRLMNGKKILYIFGDYHIDAQYQTECFYDDKYDSLDIDKFLLLFMKNSPNINYDLFCEMPESNFFDKFISINKDIYIRNVTKLFRNKIKQKYTNFKFHYMDIRETLTLYDSMTYFQSNNIENRSISSKRIIILYNELKELIILFIKSLSKNKFIKKILHKYNNPKIKKKLLYIYNKLIKNYYIIIKIIDNFIKFINKNVKDDEHLTLFYYKNYVSEDKISEKLINLYYEIERFLVKNGVVLTDLYFLRRFLDKKYINNGILYTGVGHMADISYLLVKYFNFKITHYSYIIKPIDVNLFISTLSFNNLEYINTLSDIFTNKYKNTQIYQCTNLFDFPENFT